MDAWGSVPRGADWYVEDALLEADEMALGKRIGTPLGFKTFDSFFRLKDGQLMVIAGRPAMGKTSFALQIAYNMAQLLRSTTGRVVFYSAEMTGVELFHKMAAMNSGMNLQQGYGGKWSSADADEFKRALNDLRDLPLLVNDLNLISTEHMVKDLEDMVNVGTPPRALFFDYIELAADKAGDKMGENHRIAQVAQRLKHIAMTFKIPVIAMSQVNRQTEAEANKIPYLANLAGSDTVARMADKVLSLMRPGYYLRNGQQAACEVPLDVDSTCYVSVQKDRFGRAGQTFRMRVNEETFRFTDMNPPVDPDRFVMDLRAKRPSELGLTKN